MKKILLIALFIATINQIFAQTDETIINHIVIMMDRGQGMKNLQEKELSNLITKQLPEELKKQNIILKAGDFISFLGYGIPSRSAYRNDKKTQFKNYIKIIDSKKNTFGFVFKEYSSESIFETISSSIFNSSGKFLNQNLWGGQMAAKHYSLQYLKDKNKINKTYFVQIFSNLFREGGKPNFVLDGYDANSAETEWNTFVKLDPYKNWINKEYLTLSSKIVKNYEDVSFESNKIIKTKNYSCYLHELKPKITEIISTGDKEIVPFARQGSNYASDNYKINIPENKNYSIIKVVAEVADSQGNVLSSELIENPKEVIILKNLKFEDKYNNQETKLNLKLWVLINDGIYNNTILNPYDTKTDYTMLNHSISIKYNDKYLKISPFSLSDIEGLNFIIWIIIWVIIAAAIAYYIVKRAGKDTGAKAELDNVPMDTEPKKVDFNLPPLKNDVVLKQHILNQSKSKIPGYKVSYIHHRIWIESVSVEKVLFTENELLQIEIKDTKSKITQASHSITGIAITEVKTDFSVVLNQTAIKDYTDTANLAGDAYVKFVLCSQSKENGKIVKIDNYKLPLKFIKAQPEPKIKIAIFKEFEKGYEYRTLNKVQIANVSIKSEALFGKHKVTYTEYMSCKALTASYKNEINMNQVVFLGDLDEITQSNPNNELPVQINFETSGIFLANLTSQNEITIPLYANLSLLKNPEEKEIHKLEISTSLKTGKVGIPFSEEKSFTLVKDPKKTDLLAKVVFLNEENTEKIENLNEIDFEIDEAVLWQTSKDVKNSGRDCFSFRLGNTAENNESGMTGEVIISNIKTTFLVAKKSKKSMSPRKGAEDGRSDVSEIFNITPDISKDYTFKSQKKSYKDFTISFTNGKIEEIVDENVILECIINFQYVIKKPEIAKDGSSRINTVSDSFKQHIFFTLKKELGLYWLALDLGTSAIAAHFGKDAEKSNLLPLQDSLKLIVEQAEERYEENNIPEYGTKFLSSSLMLRNNGYINADKFKDRTTGNRERLSFDDKEGSYFKDIILVAPTVADFNKPENPVLPFIKSLIGYEELPNPDEKYSAYKYNFSEKNEKGIYGTDQPTSFSEKPLKMRTILESTYNSTLRDFVIPQIAKIDKENSLFNKIILTVPNTFTPRHTDNIKAIIKEKETTQKVISDYILFISESDAVASYYIKNRTKLNKNRKNDEFTDFTSNKSPKTEYILAYDMGAGTLDLTYFKVTHEPCKEENGQKVSGNKTIEIIGKTGNTKAGNYIDYILAEEFVKQYGQFLGDGISELINNPNSKNGGAYAVELKRIVKDIIKPNLYGEGKETQGRKIFLNEALHKTRAILTKRTISNINSTFKPETLIKISEEITAKLKELNQEHFEFYSAYQEIEQSNKNLENLRLILNLKEKESVTEELKHRKTQLSEIKKEVSNFSDISATIDALNELYNTKNIEQTEDSIKEIYKKIDWKKNDKEKIEEEEKNLNKAKDKLISLGLNANTYDFLFDNFGDNIKKIRMEVKQLADINPEMVKQAASLLGLSIPSEEDLDNIERLDLNSKILIYIEKYNQGMTKVRNLMNDKSSDDIIEVFERETKKIKETLTSINKEIGKTEKELNSPASLLKANTKNVLNKIEDIQQDYDSLSEKLIQKLEISNLTTKTVQEAFAKYEENYNSITLKVLSLYGLTDGEPIKIINKDYLEIKALEKKIKEISGLSSIENTQNTQNKFEENSTNLMQELYKNLSIDFSKKEKNSDYINEIEESLNKIKKELQLFKEGKNSLLIFKNDSIKGLINEDFSLNLDDLAKSSTFNNFIKHSTLDIFDNVFNDGKGGIELNTLIMTGRSMRLKGLKTAVIKELETRKDKKEKSGTATKGSKINKLHSFALEGDELKEVVVKGALSYAIDYRIPGNDVQFINKNIYAKYGLLYKRVSGQWFYREFLNPETKPKHKDPIFRNGISVYEYEIEEVINLANSNECHFIQTYSNNPAKDIASDKSDYITKIHTFDVKEIYGLELKGAKNAKIKLTVTENDEMILKIGNVTNSPASTFKIKIEENELFKKVMWPYL